VADRISDSFGPAAGAHVPYLGSAICFQALPVLMSPSALCPSVARRSSISASRYFPQTLPHRLVFLFPSRVLVALTIVFTITLVRVTSLPPTSSPKGCSRKLPGLFVEASVDVRKLPMGLLALPSAYPLPELKLSSLFIFPLFPVPLSIRTFTFD